MITYHKDEQVGRSRNSEVEGSSLGVGNQDGAVDVVVGGRGAAAESNLRNRKENTLELLQNNRKYECECCGTGWLIGSGRIAT